MERLSTVSIQQIHLFAMVFLSLCKKPGHFLSPAWSTDYLWWPATLALSAPHTSQLLFCINFLLAYVSIYHALPTGLLWRCECSVHFSDLPQLQRNSFVRCISIRFSILSYFFIQIWTWHNSVTIWQWRNCLQTLLSFCGMSDDDDYDRVDCWTAEQARG